MAFVEASFYSRVGTASAPATPTSVASTLLANGPCLPSDDTICMPVVDAPVRFSTVMFCWGFVLVMVMFGSGMMVHNAYTELTKDVGLASLRRRLTKASKASLAVSNALRLAEERQNALLAKTRHVVETFTTEFALNGSPDTVVTALVERLKTGAVSVPVQEDRLSVAEIKELEWRAVFWWWTALVSVGACALSMQAFYTSNKRGFGTGTTVAIFVLLAFGLGLDLSKQDIVAGLTAHAERMGRRLFLRRAVRVLAVAVLVGLAVVVLSSPAAVGHLVPWFTVAATAMVVVFAGRELAPWFGFVVIHLRKVLNGIAWLLAKAFWLALALFYAVVVVVDAIVELIAAPMSLFFQRRVQTPS
jgi:hypothetical protein